MIFAPVCGVFNSWVHWLRPTEPKPSNLHGAQGSATHSSPWIGERRLAPTIDRTMSILVDLGAEAGLWTLHDPEDKSGLARLFGRAPPVADCDHGLHP